MQQASFGGMHRARYQIVLGWILAVAIPGLITRFLTGTPIGDSTQYTTIVGATISLVAGVFAFRRLHIFPGITAGGYVVMSITTTFAILTTLLILLRLDYSRVLLSVIYVITVVFFTLAHLVFDRRRKYVMGVIPGGQTARLPSQHYVDWFEMPSPDTLVPALDGVVVDLRFDHDPRWDSRITQLVLRGTPVYDVKQAVEQMTGRVEVSHLSENTLGSLNPNDVYLQIKAVADVVAAFLLLIFLMPVLVLIAVLVRLDSPGPALFRQRRTGYRGKPFVAYKFRTMYVVDPVADDAEEMRRRAMTQENDPRITRIGLFLRRSRLDELPQLINMLKGEMSLIGPRPEAVELTKWYESEIAFYHYRHIIKPGVTGWAQINLGHVVYVDQVKEKLHLDFYYVKNFSFWLDLLIVVRTIQTMVTGRGAR